MKSKYIKVDKNTQTEKLKKYHHIRFLYVSHYRIVLYPVLPAFARAPHIYAKDVSVQ